MKLVYDNIWIMGIAALLGVFGCSTLEPLSQIATSVGVQTGAISSTQADSITRGISAVSTVSKALDKITPEQEYYIGRAVGASILSSYFPYNDDSANRYVNLIGQTLARVSDMPETFGGYRFLILDSDEVNAFAAPGGLIFVTRGMLKCCKSEDAVAAVLAHEIGHVQLKHGIQSIEKSRLTAALTTALAEGVKTYGSQQIAEVLRIFEGSISDITTTLVSRGYSRAFEHEADSAAITILKRAGYDPYALIEMLDNMRTRLRPGGLDFVRTHPAPEDRIQDIQTMLGSASSKQASPSRQKRFAAALGKIVR